MARYSIRHQPRDPHWITARYAGTCAGRSCENPVKRGEEVFYYPSTKSIYCTTCSPAIARDAMAEIEDDNWNQVFHVC